jgi:hypothetical protein
LRRAAWARMSLDASNESTDEENEAGPEQIDMVRDAEGGWSEEAG